MARDVYTYGSNSWITLSKRNTENSLVENAADKTDLYIFKIRKWKKDHWSRNGLRILAAKSCMVVGDPKTARKLKRSAWIDASAGILMHWAHTTRKEPRLGELFLQNGLVSERPVQKVHVHTTNHNA